MLEIIFEGKDYYLGVGCACCMCDPGVQGSGSNSATIYDRNNPIPPKV